MNNKHFRNPIVSKMLIVQMNGYAFIFSADRQRTGNGHNTLCVQNSVFMWEFSQPPQNPQKPYRFAFI